MIDEKPLLDFAALLRNERLDAIDIIPDVHPIDNRALVIVFRHSVLMEVRNRLRCRCGREADQICIEIFQHLSPGIVDRAVTFVRHDKIEILDGQRWIVLNVFRAVPKCLQKF